MKRKDLTGQQFGLLTVLGVASEQKRRLAWNCRCACGTEKVLVGADMTHGGTMSCGCLRARMITERSTTHGMRRTRVYEIWRGMVKRCHNEECISYQNYGGRGIEVHQSWRDSFESFLADMGMPPEGMSIERKDNNGNYEPGNCRWATTIEQANNKRTTIFAEIGGLRMTVSQHARRLGIKYTTLYWQLRKADLLERDAAPYAPFPTVARAVGLPPCRPSKLYTTNGLVTPFSRGITLTSREQGEADMHRRDAIRRGGR